MCLDNVSCLVARRVVLLTCLYIYILRNDNVIMFQLVYKFLTILFLIKRGCRVMYDRVGEETAIGINGAF